MKSKLFVLQHRDSLQLLRSLSALGSGANGAAMKFNNENGLNTLAVRDFPENLASIEEAIKRLDVPSAASKAQDVELHIHVLIAHKLVVPDGGVPEELQDVLKSLKGTLTYRGYSLGGSFVQRVQIQSDGRISGRGQLDAMASIERKDHPYWIVDWSTRGLGIDLQKDAPALIRMRDFVMNLREKSDSSDQVIASFGTDLSVKENEKVVVGTSVLKDRGLIVVLTARRAN
jgi:hypothetical protein